MTRQVLQLTGLQVETGWQGAVLIDPAFVVGGGVAYLRHIQRVGISVRIRLSATETGEPLDAGPEFTGALETADEAFTFAGTNGATFTLKGPGHADNTFADSSEPYFWTPDNNTAMTAWFADRAGNFTVTLDDGVEASTAITGVAEAGAAEAAATVDRVPQLTLADFDAAGLELDLLALIRAGSGPGGTIFAVPPRGSVGALLDGELGIGASEAAITRIRRRNGAFFMINDNAPLVLADHFGSGGAGADLTVYVQTVDGLGSFPASTLSNAGGHFVQFGPIGGDDLTIVNNIDDGQSFIIALARPAVTAIAVRGSAAAGAAEASATVARVTPTVHTPGGVAATGAPEASARLRRIDAHAIRGRADAGAAEISARLRRIAAHAIAGRADAGRPRTYARLRRIARLPVRGVAESGAPQVAVRVERVPPASEQFARTLRESAPERRLLTALEIRHPAVAQPVRVVNDTEDRTIEGSRYVALRFDARLADDVEGQAPQAELAIDNVGRALTQWVEAAGGGAGATVRVMQVLDIADPEVEWELTMDVAGVQVDAERLTARLGFDPLLGRAAVVMRHDPQTSPGLF